MWRAFFLGIGISLFLIGGECLMLDKVILADRNASSVYPVGRRRSVGSRAQRELARQWAPGACWPAAYIVVLYSRSW
jgi:hypothetical protein